ncbi:uncharacterized protein LOC126821067 [Patella vulgata]|uniref:uncharacterized protein LOC126821067 n=1 Tax=Patella vulgata TaxID=6465 RepID=UPI0024A89D62|nr:uncharacterized protein LOC126821067 [Patella vulgata]
MDQNEIAKVYENNLRAFKKGTSLSESIDYYTTWSRTGGYEKDLIKGGTYNGPIEAAKAVGKFIPTDRDNVKILDIAAGTGYVGEELHQMGFLHVDALEPSEGMLDIAKEKGVYKNYILDILGGKKYSIGTDYYDCSVVSGGMGEGHIPCTGILEMIRIVKPGGIVVIAMREEYLNYVEEYQNKLEPMMEELEKEGVWEKIDRRIYENHFVGKTGVLFLYRVKDKGVSGR